MKYLFSACLMGVRCRYDGTSNENLSCLELWKKEGGVIVCPEQMGGLATPRRPSTIEGGDGHAVLDKRARLLNDEGVDVTENFLRGALESARLAELAGVRAAYLKGGSPSCGCKTTNISWGKSPGCGVGAALLQRRGIKIIEVD